MFIDHKRTSDIKIANLTYERLCGVAGGGGVPCNSADEIVKYTRN